MPVDQPGLKAALLASFTKPPVDTEESTTDISQAIKDYVTDVVLTPEAWIPVTFQNGWVNYGGGYVTAAYYKDAFNRVHLRGMIKSGTMNQDAFTLPGGYLASAILLFSTISNQALGKVAILPSGAVRPQTPSSSAWVSLAGISFRAA